MIKSLDSLTLIEENPSLISFPHSEMVTTNELIQRDAYPRLAQGSVCNRIRLFQNNGLANFDHGRMLLGSKRLVRLSKKIGSAPSENLNNGFSPSAGLKTSHPEHAIQSRSHVE